MKSLSGGERNRLLLARLFTRPANVLVLDEPTNDLDIETLELLEELLQDYDGTLFLVSHDRAFLDNVVTQVIAFEGDGVLTEYVGGYEDWQQQRAPAAVAPSAARPGAPAPRPKRAASGQKLSFKETRELEAMPAKIASLEREQTEITAALADASLYRDQPARVQALQQRYASIEEELMTCLARWEELEARRLIADIASSPLEANSVFYTTPLRGAGPFLYSSKERNQRNDAQVRRHTNRALTLDSRVCPRFVWCPCASHGSTKIRHR